MLQQLKEALVLMEGYLDLRRQMRDWHGVMDAAADIRELEAKISVLESLEANKG